MPDLTIMIGHDEVWQRNPLLATKFYIPPVPTRFVFRPKLIQRLEEGIQGKLTLVSAGAGFGKSSLLSEWHSSYQKEQQEQERSVAWISFDRADNDPVRFWQYVFAALEHILPGSGEEGFTLLQSVETIADTLIITTLINVFLSMPRRVVLILDDYHTITNAAIHQGIAFLLDHQPPQLHLIISTRTDPPFMLSRLRSRGHLNEFRADDLRFHLEETELFLKTATSLPFSEEAVAMLELRTEGWIAGLHMAALSLKGRSDSVAFINSFAGSHHYILDYLSEEVLDQQVEAVQQFLMQTSILERLSGSLCDAVVEQPKSQAVLEYLEGANLFIVPLDDERGWYRYHQLLRDVLHRRLQQSQLDLIPQLHHRSASWYEKHGFLAEAIHHALAANEHEWAAQLMEQAAIPMILRGEHNTLQLWLQSLPQHILSHHPRLCINAAWFYTLSSARLETIEGYLRPAEAYMNKRSDTLPDTDMEEMRGEIDGIRATLIRHQGDLMRAIPLFEQALQRIPPTHPFRRSLICLHLGSSLIYTGEVASAQNVLQEAVMLNSGIRNIYSLTQAFLTLSWAQVIRGHYRQAYATCQRGIEVMSEAMGQENSMHTSGVYLGMGNILYEWNELESAAEMLIKAIEGCEQKGQIFLLGVGYLYLIDVRLAQGMVEEAQALLDRVEQVLEHRRTAIPFSSSIPEYQVRIWLARNQLDRTMEWVDHRKRQGKSSLRYLYTNECLTVIKVLLAQARARKASLSQRLLEEALHLTEEIRQVAEGDKRESQVIKAQALQALILQEQGKQASALEALKQALALAEAEGYMRLFADEGLPMATLLQQVQVQGFMPQYVGKLLVAFEAQEQIKENMKRPVSTAPPPLPLLDPLSEREQEILQLIAEGQSNEEVGRTLYISMGTVKTHLKHIYGKLDVHTRTQAIACARELRLLPS